MSAWFVVLLGAPGNGRRKGATLKFIAAELGAGACTNLALTANLWGCKTLWKGGDKPS